MKPPPEGGVVSESIVRVHCRDNCGMSWAFKGVQTLEGYHFGGLDREGD